MDPILSETQQKMQKAMDVLKNDLGTIRTGRAAPSLVENVFVSVYGGSAKMKIMELATTAATDTQTLMITPFDPSVINEIAKGLDEANVGLHPSVDGQVIRISVPPLSEERRAEFVKLAHQKAENGRIQIRQIRQDAMSDIKRDIASEDEQKRLEKQVQIATDENMQTIEGLKAAKEQELMSM